MKKNRTSMKPLISLLFSISLTSSFASAASIEVYNCDANIYTDNGGGNAVSEIRKNDITLTVNSNTVTFSQNTSNYTSSFHMKKKPDNSWLGFDSAGSYLIRNPNGYYSLSFTIPDMRNMIIIAESCKKVG
ncbi:hypothetical protein [Erwinia phyllosphaerae]|uniref:hypothetical protein n=1 Tax=Erwinia phyllosphaerae TaxID=2853256 RepID=UPI001FEFFCB7|nr:hypothetical protein [Erwinia phyllosphaerae]MBV4365931.1 hypothetical protein [Erwinia phyllosphaerae]